MNVPISGRKFIGPVYIVRPYLVISCFLLLLLLQGEASRADWTVLETENEDTKTKGMLISCVLI